MSNSIVMPPEIKQPSVENDDKLRQPYHKPLLEELGDLRTVTLGGTRPGAGDSGDYMSPYDWPTYP